MGNERYNAGSRSDAVVEPSSVEPEGEGDVAAGAPGRDGSVRGTVQSAERSDGTADTPADGVGDDVSGQPAQGRTESADGTVGDTSAVSPEGRDVDDTPRGAGAAGRGPVSGQAGAGADDGSRIDSGRDAGRTVGADGSVSDQSDTAGLDPEIRARRQRRIERLRARFGQQQQQEVPEAQAIAPTRQPEAALDRLRRVARIETPSQEIVVKSEISEPY